MDQQQIRVQAEQAAFHAVAYVATPVAIVVWFLLPRLFEHLFHGGHPSGDAIGALLALAFAEIIAFVGIASALHQLRTTRSPPLLAALAANSILVAVPVILLSAA